MTEAPIYEAPIYGDQAGTSFGPVAVKVSFMVEVEVLQAGKPYMLHSTVQEKVAAAVEESLEFYSEDHPESQLIIAGVVVKTADDMAYEGLANSSRGATYSGGGGGGGGIYRDPSLYSVALALQQTPITTT